MKSFLLRQEAEMFRRGRKLFAKGFLHGMTRKLSITIGNYSQKVSYTAWDRSVS